MLSNLTEMSKDVFTPKVISGISEFSGEESGKINSALNMILPAIVGSMVKKVSNEKGSSEIMKLIRDGGYDGNILKNPDNSFSDSSKLNAVIGNSSRSVNFLIGNKSGELANLVSKETGMENNSAVSLIGIITAVVMSLTGKQLLSDNLNSKGLAEYLSAQRNFLTGLIPEGVSGILGLQDFSNVFSPMDNINYLSENSSYGSGKFKPWVLISVCAVLLFALWRIFGTDKPPVTKKSGPGKPDSTKVASAIYTNPPLTGDPEMDSLTGTIGKFINKTLPDGEQIIIAENGVEAMLIDFIEDNTKTADKETWFSFDRILFETGKSNLKSSSDYEIRNIVAIMKAYPDVEIKIGGYTDNTGDENANLRLSKERADAVRNALIEKGVEEEKIRAEGYGSRFPVASNDNNQGRERNRRVDVRITKK